MAAGFGGHAFRNRLSLTRTGSLRTSPSIAAILLRSEASSSAVSITFTGGSERREFRTLKPPSEVRRNLRTSTSTLLQKRYQTFDGS